MIITIDTGDVNASPSSGPPMFSRAGKSTINQYLAFSPKHIR